MPRSTNDAKIARGVFALFKGESGAGKSGGALSFPDAYVLDHDRKMPLIAEKHFPGVEFHWDVFKDCFEVGAALKMLYDYYPYISEEECLRNQSVWPEGFHGENLCPYKTIIGDTLTSLSQAALTTIDSAKGQSVFTMLRSINVSSRGNKSVELRSYDAYSGEDMILKDYINQLKFLWARPGNPRHVLVLAHVLSHEKTGGQQVRRLVTAGKAIAAYIPAQFDEMYHFIAEASALGSNSHSSRRLVYTDAVGEDNAKTALPLPPVFDITNGSLYDKISEFVDVGKGPQFVTKKAADYIL